MHAIEEVIGLLVVVALLAWGARAVGLPYPIVLVVGGLAIGFVPGMPDVEIDPDIVFLVFLPPLVHAAAYSASPKRLRVDAMPIAALALGLVALSIGAVAVVAHALVGALTWPAAITLGAIVAPTDPVAATAVFRRAGVPERIVGLVSGESLVNDASALVAYRLAIAAAVTGSFSLAGGAGDLVLVSAGGIAVGVVVAGLSAWLRRRLDDSLIEITVTLLTAYVAYVGAEELGVSGVLAAVASGVVLGRLGGRLFSPGTRLEANAFWGVGTFLLESTLFILVGLAFPAIIDALPGSVGALALDAALVSVVVIVVRLAFAAALPTSLSLRERAVLGWSGMRGAVSLAAALAVPLTIDGGAPFPGRDEILFLTVGVIGVTLVLQGLTLPTVLRVMLHGEGDAEPIPDQRRRALARFDSVDAALGRIAELAREDELEPAMVERARELYTSRASQLAGECRTGVAEANTNTDAWLRLRLELLHVERSELVEARDRGDIAHEVMLVVERDLDLEEERIQARIGVAPSQ